MSRQDLYDKFLASLHDAMLDDAKWPEASAHVDELCESKGNILVSGEGGERNDLKVYFKQLTDQGASEVAAVVLVVVPDGIYVAYICILTFHE